jgi:hypothetical protein
VVPPPPHGSLSCKSCAYCPPTNALSCRVARVSGDITHLNASPWRTVQYSTGWELGARERTALSRAPQHGWDHVLDTEGAPRDLAEAAVIELTALLREGPDGDQLAN